MDEREIRECPRGHAIDALRLCVLHRHHIFIPLGDFPQDVGDGRGAQVEAVGSVLRTVGHCISVLDPRHYCRHSEPLLPRCVRSVLRGHRRVSMQQGVFGIPASGGYVILVFEIGEADTDNGRQISKTHFFVGKCIYVHGWILHRILALVLCEP